MVGLAIIQKDFVAEGLNEVGLSAGLFYFPHYGKYEEYDEAQNATTLSDLQVDVYKRQVVCKDIPDGVTACGSPCRIIKNNPQP